MAGSAQESSSMYLLLLLWDGRLCCASAEDGKLLWDTQLPGGSLFHCGTKRGSEAKKETRMRHHLHSRSSCRRCQSMLSDINGVEVNLEEMQNYIIDSYFVVTSLCNQNPAEPPVKWCFLLPSTQAEKEERRRKHVWVPVCSVIDRWNESSCSVHKAVELRQEAVSYVELDFSSGKFLLNFGSEEEEEEESLPAGAASMHVIVRRMNHTQSVIFPPWQLSSSSSVCSEGRRHQGKEKEKEEERDEEVFHSWYAVTSTVALDVVSNTAPGGGDSLMKSGCHADPCLFHIGQSASVSGYKYYLYISNGRGSMEKIQLEDLGAPVVSAKIVVMDTNNIRTSNNNDNANNSCSEFACEDISVVTSCGQKERTQSYLWNFKNCGEYLQPLSGSLDVNRHVFFTEYATPTTKEASLFLKLPIFKRKMDDSSDIAAFSHDYRSEEEDDGNNNNNNVDVDEEYEDSSETDSSKSQDAFEAAVVPLTRSESLSSSTDLGFGRSPEREISFFDKNFRVVSLLGRGASGAVLLTQHHLTGVYYAVKIMLMRDYHSTKTAVEEVRLHALLHNRHLVRYYACWSEDVTPYRIQQLASIGLCRGTRRGRSTSKGGVNKKSMINTVSSMNAVNHPNYTSRHSKGYPNWLLQPDGPAASRTLLIPPPPQTTHGHGAGGCLIGSESFGSSLESSSVVGKHLNDEHDDDGDASASDTDSLSSDLTENLLDGAVVFLQLEYCQTTLAHYLGSRMSIDRITNIIIVLQIFSGLRYIHRCNCLHRDVKPTNIFLDYRCQTSTIDDITDDDLDNDDDEEEDEAGDGEETGKRIIAGSQDSNMGEDPPAMQLMQTGQPPAGEVHILSALDLLGSIDSTGLLALHLKRIKYHRGDPKKWRELRFVRKWLMRRLVQVRLGDFGLAKSLGDERIEAMRYFARSSVNTVGVGSPLYSSPEQLEGNVCTPSSDAFAAGVLMAEMYIQPTTVAERLFELKRVRDGVFLSPALLEEYPELQVVRSLTQKDPSLRMSLTDASSLLAKTIDNILLSFLSK